MNLTSLRAFATVASLGFALLAAPQSAGADSKTSIGTACMPYGTGTEFGDLLYLSGGLTTRGDRDASILCSFSVDADDGWYDPAKAASVQLFFKAGGNDAAITCTASAGSGFMYGTLTYSKSLNLPATLSDTVTIDGIQAPPMYSWTPLTVNCVLPARSTLARLVLTEGAATDR